MDETDGPDEPDETAGLATYVADTSFDAVPEDAVARAKTAARDFVGLTIHGSAHGTGGTVASYLDALGTLGDAPVDGGQTGDPATVIGYGTADPPRAAFANGAFGHVLNYDDTFESVVVHPTCTAFPAALAAAESVDGTGRDLLAGYVVGLDVAYRIGRSVAPSHWLRGWHATATVGVFGAAAAAAAVLDLSAERTRHAFGVAASLSSGLKRNIGTTTNPIHCGHAAGKGVEATMLARAGVDADGSVLGGQYGFGELATDPDGYDPTAVTDPDVEWAVRDLAFKPYPSGVVTHSAMEALRSILEREDLGPADVATVTATVDEGVTDTIDRHHPRDAAEATVSYEFCLAAVLRERDPGLPEFTDEYVRAGATRRAMEKVRLDPRPEPFGSGDAEASYGARIVVGTTDGRSFEEAVRAAPGGPSNPLGEDRLRRKFFECAETALDRRAAKRVADAIARLDEDGALADLVAEMRG